MDSRLRGNDGFGGRRCNALHGQSTFCDSLAGEADTIVVLVKHRQFGAAHVKAQLGEMQVLDLCGLLA